MEKQNRTRRAVRNVTKESTGSGLYETNAFLDGRAVKIGLEKWKSLKKLSGQTDEALPHIERAIGYYNWTYPDGRRDHPDVFRKLNKLIRETCKLERQLRKFLDDDSVASVLGTRASGQPPMSENQVAELQASFVKGLSIFPCFIGALKAANLASRIHKRGPRDAAERFLCLGLAEILMKYGQSKISRSRKYKKPRDDVSTTMNTLEYFVQVGELCTPHIRRGTLNAFLRRLSNENRDIEQFDMAHPGLTWLGGLNHYERHGYIEYADSKWHLTEAGTNIIKQHRSGDVA